MSILHQLILLDLPPSVDFQESFNSGFLSVPTDVRNLNQLREFVLKGYTPHVSEYTPLVSDPRFWTDEGGQHLSPFSVVQLSDLEAGRLYHTNLDILNQAKAYLKTLPDSIIWQGS